MSDGKSGVVRMVVLALCLGATALGFANTYGDNADVVSMAQKVACGSEGCSYTTVRQERSPFAQRFTFQVSLTEKGSRTRSATADVECKREYILLGDYQCKLTSGGLPAPAGS